MPWSQLGGAGSLKRHEMTPWVKGHSYILAVRAYSGGLGSFRPHKVMPPVLVITPVAHGYSGGTSSLQRRVVLIAWVHSYGLSSLRRFGIMYSGGARSLNWH
jgi:hypothetical protein